MPTPAEIAVRADELKTGFIALQFGIVALCIPDAPVLGILEKYGQIPRTSPLVVNRNDGTEYSTEPIEDVLRRAAGIPGAGFRGDALPLAAMVGATRLGDDLQVAGLYSRSEPLLQFTRHLRNACAHGNRWHFVNGEPKHPAELRRLRLDPSLHGDKAIWGTVGPGDYLDFLDDLRDYLHNLP